MALTEQENRVLHVAVKRYDPQVGAGHLDPPAVAEETGVEVDALPGVVERLEEEGYLERMPELEKEAVGAGWMVRPTDKGLLTAMGLA